ncbi:MAG: Bifunctional protein FolD [Candidatus Saccharibacteria bacterium]|nr:Bifunctional protein FolD [Candidatus Saccharibacteria bacterium]
MRILDGRELADYVKERQAKQVRNLRQTWKTFPKLAIVIAKEDDVIDTFVRLKQSYGEDILIDVEVIRVKQSEVGETVKRLNDDDSVQGIIIQLPLADPTQTDELVGLIKPEKDVDGLGTSGTFISATATAIDWLLAGYNVTLKDRVIAIVGQGRLVGAPLADLWSRAGLNVVTYDDTVVDLQSELRKADVIVSATGVPGLVTAQMISAGKVVVDAGTASENGVIVGDIAPDVRERQDLTITPIRGGVGPLTIAALFDNVIVAATATVKKD